MEIYKAKESPTGKWIVTEGQQVETCAGYWDSESEAEGVAAMLNEALNEVTTA